MENKSLREKIPVVIDSHLKELMPSFFTLTEKDFQSLGNAINKSDQEEICRLAHTLKGDFGNYGFMELSKMAENLEKAAANNSSELTLQIFNEMKNYFSLVEVRYE